MPGDHETTDNPLSPISVTFSGRRRFPPPWSVDDIGGCFVVKHANEQMLAYVYYDDPRAADKPLTRDEARRVAANIAKLPELRQGDVKA